MCIYVRVHVGCLRLVFPFLQCWAGGLVRIDKVVLMHLSKYVYIYISNMCMILVYLYTGICVSVMGRTKAS